MRLTLLIPLAVSAFLSIPLTQAAEPPAPQVPPPPGDLIQSLQARRIAGSEKAQARRLSLPLLRGTPEPLVWSDSPTQAKAVGFWPGESAQRVPRRVILTSCAPGTTETTLSKGLLARGDFPGPRAELRVIDKRYNSTIPWETGELVLSNNAGSLALRVGLKLDNGTIHWWQWVTMETLEDGPVCRVIRAKGAIPVHWERQESPESEEAKRTGKLYPWLHKHNHVRGEVLARLYANGVMELTVRHINGRFFTEGGDLEGVVPVIGFRSSGGDWPEKPQPVTGRQRWKWSGAALDTADAAHLLSPEHPGQAWRDGEMCIYQPYEGVQILAGVSARQSHGDEYLSHSEQHRIPKGVARSVRMVASLGNVEPDVAVYLLPDYWYGLCEDISEVPLLPVRDQTFNNVLKGMEYYRKSHHQGQFDDGAVGRRWSTNHDPGWEGETPWAQMLGAYLTGEPFDYNLALRSAYHTADVAVDKAVYAVRMHAYTPPAQSLPMQRVLGIISAYLETGDPYLLDTGESVAQTAYWWDRQNWPRRSFGRDAAYIRGLVFLYRYLGDRHYLDQAREALHRVAAVQLPDGAYTDQGGTTGIHAAMDLIVKPWMSGIVTEAMIDFLAFENDPIIEAAALKNCRWLLACQVDGPDGKHWVYEVSHGGQKGGLLSDDRPMPEMEWYDEYIAKLLGWASLRTGDPVFYKTWHESYLRYNRHPESWINPLGWDHGVNKAVSNIPWQRQRLWNAQLTKDGVSIRPRTDLAPDLKEATVNSPLGPVKVQTPTTRSAG